MEYEIAKRDFRTGDILLFSGTGFISKLIQIYSRSRWSHVGVIVDIPEYGLTLWESTTLSKCKDVFSNKSRKGFQVASLKKKIQCYEGDIAVRHLNYEVTQHDMHKLMHLLRTELIGKKYERNLFQLFLSGIPWFGNKYEDLSSLFCSEAVTEVYQNLGLIGNGRPSNNYIPADFGVKRWDVSLLKGSLSPLRIIK